jgi:glucose/arabinose dehydrogenase
MLLAVAAMAVLIAVHAPAATAYRLRTITSELEDPVSFAALPDRRFLVAEAAGQLKLIDASGVTSTVSGAPAAVLTREGAFLDVIADLNFAVNARIFLSYVEGSGDASGVAVHRARLAGRELVDGRRILRSSPDRRRPQHYGGRMVMIDPSHLFVTVGDGLVHRKAAQDLDSEMGKVLRITIGGKSAGIRGDRPGDTLRVWARGLRHPVAIAATAQGESIYLLDSGPGHGHELNRVEPAANFGWPVVSQVPDAQGALVSPFRSVAGMDDPVHVWDERFEPGGMAYYHGGQLRDWGRSLFVGTHDGVLRMRVAGRRVVSEERLFTELDAAVRDIRVHGDRLYLLTRGSPASLIEIMR